MPNKNLRTAMILMTASIIVGCGVSVVSVKGSEIVTVETGEVIRITGSPRLEAITRVLMIKAKETPPLYDVVPFTFQNLSKDDNRVTLYSLAKNGELLVGISESVAKKSSGDALALLLAHGIVLSIQGPALEDKDSLLVDIRAVQLIRSFGYDAQKSVNEVCKIVNWQRCFFLSLALQTKEG